MMVFPLIGGRTNELVDSNIIVFSFSGGKVGSEDLGGGFTVVGGGSQT